MNEKYDTYFVSEIAKRQNTDDNFGKTRMCKSARLTIFLTAEFRGKRAKLSKLGKKLHKTWEPQTNRVITVSAL